MLSESPMLCECPVLPPDMTNWWPLFSFIDGGNKLSVAVVGRVGWDVWFKNLSIIFSVSFGNSKSISSLLGGFSSFNAFTYMASAAKNSFNPCCIFNLFRILYCSSILSVNFIFSSNAARFALTVRKLSCDERDDPEFDDFIEWHDLCDDFDLMLALTDNVSSLSSANTLLNAAVCTAWIESLTEDSSSTMSSDRGVCFTRFSQLFNSSSIFSARAIISLSFLSIWSWSFVLAKNAWNAVTLAWKLLCAAFTDFSLSSQWNWKPLLS